MPNNKEQLCQRTWSTGDPCERKAVEQICGVYMCEKHREILHEEEGAAYRLYMIRQSEYS